MGLLTDAILCLKIGLFILAVPWLARLPVRRLEAFINPGNPRNFKDARHEERIIRLTDLCCRAARRFMDKPCQLRGFTLYYFLRRAGADVSLVFGIGVIGSIYEGHCWLVKDEEPYLETVDPRRYFTAMYAFNQYPRQMGK